MSRADRGMSRQKLEPIAELPSRQACRCNCACADAGEERRRIALLLHDVLASDLVMINIMAGRVRQAATGDLAEDAALLVASARAALAGLRRILRPLREPVPDWSLTSEQPTTASLQQF